jgi:hypothetical protein
MDDSDIIDTLKAMKRQDEVFYATTKGLYEDATRAIDADSRLTMVEWCKRIADFGEYSHDTVSIAINALDRYVEKKPEILDDTQQFQLFTLTCLYTAIKVHEAVVLTPEMMSRLSKEVFSEKAIEQAESELLETIDWRMNPPTPHAFCDSYLALLISHYSDSCSVVLRELVHFQIDYVLGDADFVGTHASDVAFAAICNACKLAEPHLYNEAKKLICNATGSEVISIYLTTKLYNQLMKLDIRPRPVLSRRSSSKRQFSHSTSESPRGIADCR